MTSATNRWGVLAAYTALAGVNQMLWLTFAPVTTPAADEFGVSVGSIGLLSEIFPFVYVVLAIPAGLVLDRRLRPGLALGGVLTGAGGVLRLGAWLAGPAYAWLLVGQLLVAVAQPFVLNAVTQVAGGYLSEHRRTQGIAAASAGLFAGMVVALGLGAVLDGHLQALLGVQAVLGVVATLALVAALRRRPAYAVHGEGVGASSVLALLRDRYLRTLTGLVFLGFGLFVAITTWLQALLEPAGVSASRAGLMLVLLVLAGVVGSAALPGPVAEHRREVGFLTAATTVAAVCCAVLAVFPGFATGVVVSLALGATLLATLPVVLSLVERRAGAAGGTAAALVWLSGNLGGLLVALVVQVLLDVPGAAFWVLAALAAVAAVVTRHQTLREPQTVARSSSQP